MITRCCCCHKVRVGSTWVDADERHSDVGPVSHGYCPPCAEKAFADAREQLRTLPLAAWEPRTR